MMMLAPSKLRTQNSHEMNLIQQENKKSEWKMLALSGR